jgi:hypothetical protein
MFDDYMFVDYVLFQVCVICLLTMFCFKVVAHVVAHVNVSGDVRSVETKIISHLSSSRTINEDQSQDEQVNPAMANLRRSLRQLGVRIQRFFARKGNSITTMFICESIEELQMLREHFDSGLMEEVLQNVFTTLADEQVCISQLKWTTEDYDNCMQLFGMFQ